jgi:2-polyprenyl-3-methyl-5-hydroxy-6-metoxy-1,4-benzoquinol methylase
MPGHTISKNINSSFFDGYYKDIWREIFPEKTTLAEVDWIISEGNLQKADHVLDIMCGHGRHTLEMAKRGLKVTAVDNLPDYIDEIKKTTKTNHLDIDAYCTDVLEIQIDQKYDAILCMGNSIQFFNEEELLRLLSVLSEHLNPGRKFFINTWSLAEIAIKNFKENAWSRVGEMMLLSECKFLFHPTRMEMNTTMISKDGKREEKKGVDYIYSINEMESLLNKTGFRLKEIYSIPGKKLFTVGEPRAYIVAEKIS